MVDDIRISFWTVADYEAGLFSESATLVLDGLRNWHDSDEEMREYLHTTFMPAVSNALSDLYGTQVHCEIDAEDVA